MPAPTTTLRLRPALRSEIARLARRHRRSFSEVAQDLMEEALRLRTCPGIYFADEPNGREAKLAGTGLGVWEVIRDYLELGRTRRRFESSFRNSQRPKCRRASCTTGSIQKKSTMPSRKTASIRGRRSSPVSRLSRSGMKFYLDEDVRSPLRRRCGARRLMCRPRRRREIRTGRITLNWSMPRRRDDAS